MKNTKILVIGQLAFTALLVTALLKTSGGHEPAEAHAAAAEAGKEHAGPDDPAAHEADTGDKKGDKKDDKRGDKKDDKRGDKKGDKKGEPGEAAAEAHAAKAATGHGAPGHPEKAGEEGAHGFAGEPMVIARELLAGNGRFADGQRTVFDLTAQREAAAAGQHPGAMVLGCADSRVAPEFVFDRGLGELFVVRSAGNIAEPVAIGSLEYAAEHLHAKVLVVLGHDKCGAVQAALAGTRMPTRNLESVVDHILPGLKGLKDWAEGSDLVRLAVEANVRRQADELLKRSPLLRQAVAKKEITLLRAVYDLDSGRVRPL